MGAFVDATFIERVKEDIKIGCEKLQEYGYESLVIMVCKHTQDPYITGSQRGIDFLEVKDVFVSEFMEFCDSDKLLAKSYKDFKKTGSDREKSWSPTIVSSIKTEVESLNTPAPPDETESKMVFVETGDDYDDTPIFGSELLTDDFETYGKRKTLENTDVAQQETSLKVENIGQRSSKKMKKIKADKDQELELPEIKVILTRLKNSKSKDGPEVRPMVSLLNSQTASMVKQEYVIEKDTLTESYSEGDEDEPVKNEDNQSAEETECKFCLKGYSTQTGLDTHIKQKHEKNRRNIKCCLCSKACESSISLGDHLAKEHENYPLTGKESFPCAKCKFVFSFKTHLMEHNQRNSVCKEMAENRTESNEIKDSILQSEITYKDQKTGEFRKKTIKDLLNNNDKPRTCEVCLKSFDRPYSFRRHIFQHSAAKYFKCHVCLYEFNMEETMRRHWKLHDAKPYFCSKCFERYETRARLDYHISISCKLTTEKPELRCSVCDLQTNSKSALEIHEKSHAGVKDWSCDICGKLLVSKESLHRHQVVVHSEEAPHECYECGKKYKIKDALRKHILIHGEKAFKCHLCDYAAVDASNLRKHQQVHTKERPFICDFCGNSFARKVALENHRRLHTGERPYKCDFEGCDKAFRNLFNLRQHKCYHSSTYSYVCDFCGRKFKVRSAYKHHRRYHTVEFRWPCEYCEEKFKSRLTYKTHIIRQHVEKIQELESKSTIKFYQCNLCPKIFSAPEHLNQHVNVHMGSKPFKCRFCNKGFSSKGNMLQHEKSHTGGKTYRCSYCAKSYSTAEMFQQHLEVKHSQKVDLDYLVAMATENVAKIMQNGIGKTAVRRLGKAHQVRRSVPSQTPQETIGVETYGATALHPVLSHIIGETSQDY